jgi:hypothetical protein
MAQPLVVWVRRRVARRARLTAAAHEVGDLAFDLGVGGAVVGAPGGVGLPGAGDSEAGFVVADGDAVAGLGVGALGA